MTQNEKVLNHLRLWGGITTLEAYNYYGITRLSARIKNLRDDGHRILSVQEIGKNRDGVTVHYTRYILAEQKGA